MRRVSGVGWSRPWAVNRMAVGFRVGSSQPESPDVQVWTSMPKRPSWPAMPGNASGFGTGGDSRIALHAPRVNASASATPSRSRSSGLLSAPGRGNAFSGERLEGLERARVGERVAGRGHVGGRTEQDALDG